MKSTDKFVLVLVASLFLLLAGCGGGGGSSSAGPAMCPAGQMGTPPNCTNEVDPVDPSVNLSGLSVPAKEYMIGAGMTEKVGEGRNEVILTCSAAADCAFTVADDGTVTATSGEVTAALSDDALGIIRVADTKAAASKKEKIAEEAAQVAADDHGIGGEAGVTPTTTGNVAGEYNLSIKYGETSIVKEVDTVAANNEKFTQAMDLGGGTTMHVLTMDADDDGDVVEEVVIVSTDIEAPTPTAFAMVTGQTLNVSTADPGTSFEALAVDQTSSDVLALVMSSSFTANTAAELTFTDDDTATTDEDEAFETAGTYNGAMGTYRCDGTADCTVTLNAMGMITAMSDGWIFTPDEGATSDVPDADYLHYGVWLQKTTDGDGVVNYDEVETFAGSSVNPSGDVSAVTGRATYSGGATGVYVHEVRNPAGNIDTATSGHFTADVALTAYFGQVYETPGDSSTPGTIAPNLLNKLSGTINNFMLSGHDDGPGWSLNLQGGITTSSGTVADADGTVGTAEGRDDGSFSATFHGSTDDGAGAATVQPTSVVGEFDALFSNGSVAGAFGARKQAE